MLINFTVLVLYFKFIFEKRESAREFNESRTFEISQHTKGEIKEGRKEGINRVAIN